MTAGASVILVGGCDGAGTLTDHEDFKDILRTGDAHSGGVKDYNLAVLLLAQLEVFAFSSVA